MNALLKLFIAGSVAVATAGVSGMSWSADEDTSPQGAQNSSTQVDPQAGQVDPQAGPSDKPASEASDKSNRPDDQKGADASSPRDQGSPSTEVDPQAGPSDKPASEVSDKSNKSEQQKGAEAYSANLKKCEIIGDATQKQQCIEKAEKDRNQM
jgi:hypothetical protein